MTTAAHAPVTPLSVFDMSRHRGLVDEVVERARGEDAEARVWVAGCGTGERAYGLAIVLSDACRRHGVGPGRVLATERSEPALQCAVAGVYPTDRLYGLDDATWREHFAFDAGSGLFRVRRALRDVLRFVRVEPGAPFPIRGPFGAVFAFDRRDPVAELEARLGPGGRLVTPSRTSS